MLDNELLQTFVEESTELLENLEQNLLKLEKRPDDKELIKEIFRLIHTIKGSSALVGCCEITNFVHHAEDLLDQIRNNLLELNSEVINILFIIHDIIKDLINSLIIADYEIDIDRLNLTIREIQNCIDVKNISYKRDKKIALKRSEQSKVYNIKVEFNTELFQTGTDPLLLLRELNELGCFIEVYLAYKRIPDFFEIDPVLCYLTIEFVLKTKMPFEKIKDVFVFIEIDSNVKIEDVTKNYRENIDETLVDKKPGEILVDKGLLSEEDIDEALSREILTKKRKVDSQQINKVLQEQQESRSIQEKSTIKVSTDKMELLMNSVAELVISQARVKERISRKTLNDDQQLNASLQEVDKKIRFLQEEVMKARMVPIGNTFLRFRRLVRDLSRDHGKKVNLVIRGKETELDKMVIEKIVDPLKHMLRNAIDHGIELPEERTALGKVESGTITLDAYHREGYIFIEITDDGRGLDKERIRESAIKRGIISNDNLPAADEQIHELIFEPGLSTSDEITETSGRGVGMDVVKSNIEALRGSISINSMENKGTKYRLKLPLTLSIIDGMSVIVGDKHFIIPINSIIEFYQPNKSEIKSVSGKGESVRIRGEYLSLFRLSKLFSINNNVEDPINGILIVLKDDDKKITLLVDEIIGQQQAVVKSLEDNYDNVQGIAGATILGNGRVAMIIDVSSLMKIAFK